MRALECRELVKRYEDVIAVDGRDRVNCVKHAMPKLKPGGVLVLDDSHRPRYREAFERHRRMQGEDHHAKIVVNLEDSYRGASGYVFEPHATGR